MPLPCELRANLVDRLAQSVHTLTQPGAQPQVQQRLNGSTALGLLAADAAFLPAQKHAVKVQSPSAPAEVDVEHGIVGAVRDVHKGAASLRAANNRSCLLANCCQQPGRLHQVQPGAYSCTHKPLALLTKEGALMKPGEKAMMWLNRSPLGSPRLRA